MFNINSCSERVINDLADIILNRTTIISNPTYPQPRPTKAVVDDLNEDFIDKSIDILADQTLDSDDDNADS